MALPGRRRVQAADFDLSSSVCHSTTRVVESNMYPTRARRARSTRTTGRRANTRRGRHDRYRRRGAAARSLVTRRPAALHPWPRGHPSVGAVSLAMRGSRGSDRLGGVIGAEGNGSDALSGFSGSRCRDRDIPDEGRAGVGRPGVRRRIAPEPGHGGYLAPLVKTSSPRRPSARRRVLARGRLAAHPSEVAHSRQKQASARGISDEQGSHQRSLRLVPA
jgi:hypothetical protein